MDPTPPQPTPRCPPTLSALLFPRLFTFSLLRLCIYINKLYSDVDDLTSYYTERHYLFALISLFCLVAPSIVHSVYCGIGQILRNRRNNFEIIGGNCITGLLLIPWQIKRYIDGLVFASPRVFVCRPGTSDEVERVNQISRQTEVLEFFEDFYAGFLGLALELYILWCDLDSWSQQKVHVIYKLWSSAMSIFSMLVAVRRRDDGVLTGALSMLGWISMFTSRIIVFVLATSILRFWFVPLALVHALCITKWIYNLAVESHQKSPKSPNSTLLFTLTFLFFGLPSLLLWPFLFQLKTHFRPYIFLGIASLENAILLTLWWYCKPLSTSVDIYALLVVILGTVLADLFLTAYSVFKADGIDQIVLQDMHQDQNYTTSESFGMYYHFTDMIFQLRPSPEEAEKMEIELKALQDVLETNVQ